MKKEVLKLRQIFERFGFEIIEIEEDEDCLTVVVENKKYKELAEELSFRLDKSNQETWENQVEEQIRTALWDEMMIRMGIFADRLGLI
jgi:predicted site-specific integrase-resolvase